MLVKLVGSVLVIFTGSFIGFKIAMRYSERPRQIGQIISCLAALKSHINYVTMPLPEALAACANGIQGPVAELFLHISHTLREKKWFSPRDAMEKALIDMQEKLALENAEQEILLILGANLGLVNREEQYKYIGVVENQLYHIEQEAVRLREKNVKMYQYLGVCGSLALVILLI